MIVISQNVLFENIWALDFSNDKIYSYVHKDKRPPVEIAPQLIKLHDHYRALWSDDEVQNIFKT
jgi:hypothetical protein